LDEAAAARASPALALKPGSASKAPPIQYWWKQPVAERFGLPEEPES